MSDGNVKSRPIKDWKSAHLEGGKVCIRSPHPLSELYMKDGVLSKKFTVAFRIQMCHNRLVFFSLSVPHLTFFQVVAAFYDPCNLRTNPGWPLRNLLALAVVRWDVTELRVLAYRERRGQIDLQLSLIVDVELPSLPGLDFLCENFG